MENSRWIWYPGDFEIYHSMQLHSRREEFGVEYPAMWGLAAVYPRVAFSKDFESDRNGYVKIHANGKAYVMLDGKRFAREVDIPVCAGKHKIEVHITREDGGLPAIFCESDLLISDKSWGSSTRRLVGFVPAGDEPAFTSVSDNVEKFPFEYTKILPVSKTETDFGTLYDFEKELFGKLEFSCDTPLTVNYGESFEEAIDREHSILCQSVGKGNHSLVARAFRYVSFNGDVADLRCQLELLPERYVGNFKCDDPTVENIYNICAYTFHLNSREFLLDGIKRDRWCWSGDAYQSYMVNDYLFADRALNRRTITALYGKPPYVEHINTINDYSALLIIGTWEYYFTTGDAEFIKFIYPRVKELYNFICSRLDENGLVVEREGDWIFIDWSDMDKSGPVAAEQILLWQTHRAMSKLSEVVGETGSFECRADKLRETINELFWDEEKQTYIDTYTSGKRHVTRHAAIFAILYDFCDNERTESMVKSVLENEDITQITTPYFEFYELMALSKVGNIEHIQKTIKSYWGGMISLGATTIWEEYDPKKKGVEHYAMYGSKYAKSLCHAWGCGPVYLLGRYCLGVHPSSVGSKTYRVAPNPGIYKTFSGTVPVRNGKVTVEMSDGELSVTSNVTGGTLVWNGAEYKIPHNKKITVKR